MIELKSLISYLGDSSISENSDGIFTYEWYCIKRVIALILEPWDIEVYPPILLVGSHLWMTILACFFCSNPNEISWVYYANLNANPKGRIALNGTVIC